MLRCYSADLGCNQWLSYCEFLWSAQHRLPILTSEVFPSTQPLLTGHFLLLEPFSVNPSNGCASVHIPVDQQLRHQQPKSLKSPPTILMRNASAGCLQHAYMPKCFWLLLCDWLISCLCRFRVSCRALYLKSSRNKGCGGPISLGTVASGNAGGNDLQDSQMWPVASSAEPEQRSH